MKKKDNMPSLVYWGLYGINSRGVARGFLWLCVLLAVASVVLGVYLKEGHEIGVFFLAAAAWYWYAIKWVDKNSSWGKA